MQQSNHELKLLETLEKLKKISPLSHEWKETDKNKKLDFVNYVRSDSDNGLQAARGEGVIPFSIKKVQQLLEDTLLVPSMNKKVKSIEIIGQANNGFQIKYGVFKPPLGDERDTLQIHKTFEDNGDIYLLGTSIVDDDLKPEVQGKIRATHHYQLYKLTINGDNQTRIAYISCMDPKGWFPGFVKQRMNNYRGIQQLEFVYDYLIKNQ